MGEQVNEARVEVAVGENGVISVPHDLATERVLVACETADGRRVGYAGAVPISDCEVEVVPVPGGPEVTTVILTRLSEGC